MNSTRVSAIRRRGSAGGNRSARVGRRRHPRRDRRPAGAAGPQFGRRRSDGALQRISAFPTTPTDDDGTVRTGEFRELIERLCVSRADSIGVLGSTGGYAYLGRDERRRAISAAVGQARGRKPIMVGVGALRTDDAVALARDAGDAGADALLLAPMSYTPLFDHEVHAHFAAVAASAALPICIYDNPATTNFTFSPELVGRLAALPNVVALKSPAPGPLDLPAHIAALRAVVPPNFSVGSSVDLHAAEALLAGAQCWYSVLAGTFPAPSPRSATRVLFGEVDRARSLSARLEPVWRLMRIHGGIRIIYALARLQGLHDADPPRPILPLAPPDLSTVRKVVEETQLADDASWV